MHSRNYQRLVGTENVSGGVGDIFHCVALIINQFSDSLYLLHIFKYIYHLIE